MNAPLTNLYRQAEDYFFRGISAKCLDLDDGAHAYMTGGAELNFIYITGNTNALDKILIQGKHIDKINFCLLDVSDFERIGRLKKRNTYGVDQNMLNWISQRHFFNKYGGIVSSN